MDFPTTCCCNNAKYLQRNIGRPIHVEYSKFKKEERANNEIVRSGPVEDVAGRKETEEVELTTGRQILAI